MRASELTGALTDPQEVGRAVVPVVGEAVAPGERLLVAEEQCLVRRVEVDLVELVLRVQVDAARGHEPQRAVDLGGEQVVAAALGAGVDVLEVPRVHVRQVGEAALGERPQEVEGGRGLVVRPHEPVGIGTAGRRLEREVVDHVAAERRELELVARLGGRRTRLGELPGDAADLHRGDTAAVREHDGHLQDDLELVADGVGGERVERLGAVAGLQHEPALFGDRGECLGEAAGLAREHERRDLAQRRQRPVERRGIGPVGLLSRPGSACHESGAHCFMWNSSPSWSIGVAGVGAGGGHRYPLGPVGAPVAGSMARRRIWSS